MTLASESWTARCSQTFSSLVTSIRNLKRRKQLYSSDSRDSLAYYITIPASVLCVSGTLLLTSAVNVCLEILHMSLYKMTRDIFD